MKYSVEKRIEIPNLWEPELYGQFVLVESGVNFYFSNCNNLYLYSENSILPKLLQHFTSDNALTLPSDWQLIDEGDPYLLFNSVAGIDTRNNKMLSPVPAWISERYLKNTRPEKFYIENPFFFEEHCVSHKGQTGYICKKNGKRLWEFRGCAYLYTDIRRYKDFVYFGTGGRSGYFYLLDLATGSPIAQIKTGGTSCIETVGNKCYFLRCDKYTELICLNMDDGEIIESVPLPGKSFEKCKMQIIANKVHAITFEYQDRDLKSAVWNIVDL